MIVDPPNSAVARLRAGVYLPTWTNGLASGGMPRFSHVLEMAKLIEDVGFDQLWIADEFNPTLEDGSIHACWESWTILSAIAARTDRITIGPLVASMGFRSPALLAKMADTLDEVSGGRLVLGIGAGYDEDENRMFGFPSGQRVSRLEEYLAIVRGLLRNGEVDFEGHFFSTRGARLHPRGPRPEGPPILVGTIAIGPRLMRCVARWADVWNVWIAFEHNQPLALKPHAAAFEAACVEVGRDPGRIVRSVGVAVQIGDGPFTLGSIDLAPIAIRGTPVEIAGQLAAFSDAGIDEVAIYTFPIGPREIERFGRVLEALRSGL